MIPLSYFDYEKSTEVRQEEDLKVYSPSLFSSALSSLTPLETRQNDRPPSTLLFLPKTIALTSLCDS